ncbi:GD22346 [Drosophila simulans]|uniref:GD22346 n=1 Tax=Drosophila simulans TaxID=7240 RepID=B4Q7U7_DROSI|nr:GD22346 [Drosophila simulans]
MSNLKNIKNRSKFYDQQDEKRTHKRRRKVAARLDAKPIQDEPVTSSGEGLYPRISRMVRRMSSTLWSRLWGISNQSTASARQMTHPNEPSNLHPPRMDSRQIPPWQASPTAYLGYRFRLGR